MATTPPNVSLSDSKPQTEAQAAGIEMQVQPSVSVASPGPTPSDAAEDEKRMLDAIGGALEQGPRAVVHAMWITLPRGEAYDICCDKIYELIVKGEFEELPISAACAMGQGLAVISKLMQAFSDHVMKKGKYVGWTAMHWAAWKNSNAAVFLELLTA
jgi:hypothetical protein